MRITIKMLMIVCFIFAFTAVASQKIVTNNDIKLMTEDFGDPEKDAVLLIMGAGASYDYWPNSFCNKLKNAGYYVIRYDHRDTGESSHLDFQKHPYDLSDLTNDALAILDAYHIQKAHIVGFSMGGFIGQEIAIHHPERANSLTFIATTAYYKPLMTALEGEPLESDLPPPDPIVIAKINQLLAYKPKSLEDQVQQMIDFWKVVAGTGPFDAAYWKEVHEKALKRENLVSPNFNHVLAQKQKMEDKRPFLKQVEIPALVLQGKEDPFFPEPHAIELAKAFKYGYLQEIPKMGHVMAPYYEDTLIETMLKRWDKS